MELLRETRQAEIGEILSKSNARLKLAKYQAKAKQYPKAELLPSEN